MVIIKNIIRLGGAFSLLLLSSGIAQASPWAAVGDMQLRNDVEILARHNVISGPVNTWPISWKQITRNLSRTSEMDLPPYVRLAVMRVKEKIPGEFRTTVHLQLTNNPAIVRGFQKTARNDLDASATLEYNNDDSGTTVHLEGGYRKGNGEDYAHLDSSYLSQDIGNWSAYAGAFDRWWGPGRESTLILSNNARPMPSVGLRRIEPKAFETKWLSWIGPWQWDMFVAKMEKDRHVPNALIAGMRLSFEPINNFEVGLSRTMQLCGDGRPCGFASWTKALVSIGDLDNPVDRTDLSQEPGNQLASIDFSYTASISEKTNLKLYAEGAAEDLLLFLPYKYAKMIGISVYGPYRKDGAQWRVSAEFSDTVATLVWFGGTREKYVLYNHHIYQSGYRYKGRSIGHSLDSNSQLISFSADYITQNNWTYTAKFHHALVNRFDDGFFKNPVSTVKEKINLVEASVQVPMKIGDLYFSMRLHDDSPNTPDKKEAGVDINIFWSHYF